MNVAEARQFVRKHGLQAGESTYGDADVDRAIIETMYEFDRIVHSIVTTATAAVTGSSDTFTVGATDFRPERLIQARLQYVDKGVYGTGVTYNIDELFTYNSIPFKVTGTVFTTATTTPPNTSYYQQLATKLGDKMTNVGLDTVAAMLGTTGTSQPTSFAFSPGSSTGYIAPLSQTNRILWLQYNPIPTKWVEGTSGASSIQINIPDEYLRPILRTYAVGSLQFGDKSVQDKAAQAKADGEKYMRSVAGKTGLETGVIVKNPSNYI